MKKTNKKIGFTAGFATAGLLIQRYNRMIDLATYVFGATLERLFMRDGSKSKTFGKEENMSDVVSGQVVAELFGVNAKMVNRWANEGRIPSFKTPGGHHRYYLNQILPLVLTRNPGESAAPNVD